MNEADQVVGCIVRWCATIATLVWLIYAVADFAWSRLSMVWKLAALAVLRRDAVRKEVERRAQSNQATGAAGDV